VPTVFVSDSFTEASDVSLTAHLPEIGGAWLSHPGFGTNQTVLASDGRVRGNSTSLTSVQLNSATPPSHNFVLRGVSRRTSSLNGYSGYAFRFNAVERLGYAFFFLNSTTNWVLRKYTGPSTFEDLASGLGFGSNSTDYSVLIEVDDARIRVWINGVSVIDHTDTSPILSAGLVGIYNRQNGLIDNFVAEIPDPPPAQLSQSLIEVILAASVDGQLSQALIEVVLRDTTLTTDANVALTGQALLDLGIVLDGQAQVGATVEADLTLGTPIGTGLLEIGVTADPADLRAPAGLRGDFDVSMLGEASLMLGTEINLVGDGARIAASASARLRVGPETARNTGSFFLLF
jgi:hypothetical protein